MWAHCVSPGVGVGVGGLGLAQALTAHRIFGRSESLALSSQAQGSLTHPHPQSGERKTTYYIPLNTNPGTIGLEFSP